MIQEKETIICFSNVGPNDLWQRPQQLMSRLGKYFDVIYFYTTSPKGFLKNRDLFFDNIKFIRLIRFPKENSLLNFIKKTINRWKVSKIAKRHKNKEVKIWIHHLECQPYLKLFNRKKVFYDCIDDIESFPGIKRKSIEEERKLEEEADVIVVVCNPLRLKKEKTGKPLFLVRNGADLKFQKNSSYSVPDDLKEIKSPLIGFVGAISEWVDIDLIMKAAERLKKFNFVFIGPAYNETFLKNKTANFKNIHWLGSKKHEDLPRYISHFDVCLIPFRLDNDLTLVADPVKNYEYLALGKPVVSTALPELKRLLPYVYLAENDKDFISKIKQAFTEKDDQDKIKGRLKLARENSWDERVKQIIRIINNA